LVLNNFLVFMSIKERIEKDLEKALKSGDSFKKDTLRFLLSVFQNKQIELRSQNKTLTEEEAFDLLRKEIKKRLESFEIYSQAGRNDLALKEKNEADLISSYLPPEVSDDELKAIINAVIKELNVNSINEMGKVIKEVIQRTKGRAASSKIAEFTKKILSSFK